jgi:succinyl-CoA synthetase beta subunit
MRLYEHEGKSIFARYGIPIPVGTLLRAGDPPPARGYPALIKAQVLSGGRGKAGAILEVADPQAAAQTAAALQHREVNGERSTAVLLEEQIPLAGELYLAILVDRVSRQPVVLFSDRGGMEVEQAAADRLVRAAVDPLLGPRPYLARRVIDELDLDPALAPRLWAVLDPLYRLFAELGCELAEINPLGLTPEGRLVALDAKLEVDDKAAALNPELSYLERPGGSPWERRAAGYGMSASEVGGAMLVVCGGAGITMATGDLVRAAGGSLAAVVDLQDAIQGRPERAQAVMELLRAGPGSLVFFNFYMQVADCSMYARAIADVFAERRERVVARLYGNRSPDGRAILREHGFAVFEQLEDGVRAAAELERRLRGDGDGNPG